MAPTRSWETPPRPFPVAYSPKYRVDYGAHVFPVEKYDRIWQALREDDVLGPLLEAVEPEPLPLEDLARVHTREYLQKLEEGRLTPYEVAILEIPYRRDIYEAFRISCGGTWLAARWAMRWGLGVHIGGGFHHAFPDHGEGFCMLNDVAVAIEKGLAEGLFQRALIVDLDVHHGNGNAAIFAGRSDVFTFSIHQENNYPVFKPPSHLDIGLPDGADDRMYLEALRRGLATIETRFEPDIVFYIAGADPYEHDRLGGLGLTMAGFRERDVRVFEWVRRRGAACVITLGGGYALRVEDTVAIHVQTIREALRLWVKGE
jgi:acetoin utilization deacetylase AcuC-like enzyme